MALINADRFRKLAEVSSATGTRKPGKFFSVFICGEMREGQNPGTYQCMKSFDSKEYFINNAQSVYFVPLYIKRYWTKYQDAVNQKGDKYQKLIGFGWKDGSQKPEGAKVEYEIAGFLFDIEKKDFVKHPSDYPEAEIKAGDRVLVHFKCAGVKCGSAIDLLNRIAEKAKGLQPLCDNPEVEKNVISIRRFIIKAAITTRKTNFGNRMVFDFYPETVLGDKTVEAILDASEKLLPDFEYQFDKSEQVQSAEESAGSEKLIDQTSTTVDVDDVPSVDTPASSSSEFDIDF